MSRPMKQYRLWFYSRYNDWEYFNETEICGDVKLQAYLMLLRGYDYVTAIYEPIYFIPHFVEYL